MNEQEWIATVLKPAEDLDRMACLKTRTAPVIAALAHPLRIRPASDSSGFENTAVNHDTVLALAAQVWQQEHKNNQ